VDRTFVCVHRHDLSSAHFLHHARFCLFIFLTVLIWSPTVVFQHFSKSDKQGWLTSWPHGPSPILCDTVPLFVNTDLLLCHGIFICSNAHWRLVYLVCDGSLYCFCLLAESYKTKKHYHLLSCAQDKSWISVDSCAQTVFTWHEVMCSLQSCATAANSTWSGSQKANTSSALESSK